MDELYLDNGRSVDLDVRDKCYSCAAGDLDLSPAAFAVLEPNLGVGRLHGG